MSNDSITVEGGHRLSKSYQLEVCRHSSSEEDVKEKESSWRNLLGIIRAILKCKLTKAFFLGQGLSCCIAGTSYFASSLASRDIMLPSFLNTLAYATLAIIHIYFVIGRPLKLAFWKYMAYTAFDVLGAIATLTSFKHTSMTSVMLLDCVTIPVVMVLSILFLAAKYTKWHTISAIVCLGGLTMIVVSDMQHLSDDDHNAPSLKGDLIAVLGASMYGTANVLQEMIVKRNDRKEFLAMVGVIGTCYSAIAAVCFGDFRYLNSANFTFTVIGLCIAYIVCFSTFMMGLSLFLTMADAALLNLSLLTSDFYGLIIGIYGEYYAGAATMLMLLRFRVD